MITMKKCPFCAEKILAEAVKCKHCSSMLYGLQSSEAPQKKRSIISAISRLFFSLLVLVVLIAVFSDAGTYTDVSGTTTDNSSSAANRYPECASSDAGDNFKSTFDESQYAKVLNLTAIDIIDQKELSRSFDGQKLVCQATLMLNNAAKSTYRFTLTPASDGQFYIEGRPVDG
jgi:hypothetical protein